MKTQFKKPKGGKLNATAKAGAKAAPSLGVVPNKTPPSLSAAKPVANGNASSKHDKILTLLRKPNGATIAALMTATGWQAHSLRGFFSSVVRKKLRLQLESEKVKEERRYRIVSAQ